MKFVNQDVQLIEQGPGLQGIYDIICQASSTCYKSTPRSGQEAKTFVDKLIKNGHLAMLEFGTVYLHLYENSKVSEEEYKECYRILKKYGKNEYSTVFYSHRSNMVSHDNHYYITTNYRVLVENGWLDDLKYLSEYTDNYIARPCVKLITSIGIARELTRHRVFSFAQESTRYVNYGKKFNEIEFIKPKWYSSALDDQKQVLKMQLASAERAYNALINEGCTPQEAREVLPLAAKTEICMCGFRDDWKHFFDLRLYGTTGKPHPDMEALAQIVYDKIVLPFKWTH